MFYVGNTFDEKANKGYKTIQNAKRQQKRMACRYGMKKV